MRSDNVGSKSFGLTEKRSFLFEINPVPSGQMMSSEFVGNRSC